jgi:hypothetical protein
MIVITTMDALPDCCYECPCHNGEHSICEADKDRRSTYEYRPYWCPLKEGYVSVPFSWLVKFCTHFDFVEPLTDAEREVAWRQKLRQQFGIDPS